MIRSLLILSMILTFGVPARAQHLTLVPDSTDFCNVPINSTQQITVKAFNRNASPLTIQGGLIRQSLYFEIVNVEPIAAAFPPYMLSPDDSIVATIEFTPDSIGAFDAILSYTFSDGVQQEYHMKGNGVAKSGVQMNLTPETKESIWPNPAMTFVDVVSGRPFDPSARIQLRDMLGQVVASVPPTGDRTRLICSDLRAGSYLVTESVSNSLVRLGTLSIVH
jgi:hypothetical protein